MKAGFKSITKEELLEKVSPLDIYSFYMPWKFVLNRTCLNPFVSEKVPSFVISDLGGRIHHKAFNSDNRGSGIDFVMQMFRISFTEAISKISEDFGLSDKSGKKYVKIIENLPKIEKEEVKDTIIEVVSKAFTIQELKYWEQYYQGLDDLIVESIVSPKNIWINGKKQYLKASELTFCYYYSDIDKWKIYKPLVNKRWKWITNCPFVYIEHLEAIKGCNIAIINKSKKDRMVLRKALELDCICTTQAEDSSCWTEETINFVKNNSKVQVCTADNDLKGKQYSWWTTKVHGFKHCNVPDKYLSEGISDFADYARVYGLEVVKEHFKLKGLI